MSRDKPRSAAAFGQRLRDLMRALELLAALPIRRHTALGMTIGSAFGFAAGVVVDVEAVPAVILAVAVGAVVHSLTK